MTLPLRKQHRPSNLTHQLIPVFLCSPSHHNPLPIHLSLITTNSPSPSSSFHHLQNQHGKQRKDGRDRQTADRRRSTGENGRSRGGRRTDTGAVGAGASTSRAVIVVGSISPKSVSQVRKVEVVTGRNEERGKKGKGDEKTHVLVAPQMAMVRLKLETTPTENKPADAFVVLTSTFNVVAALTSVSTEARPLALVEAVWRSLLLVLSTSLTSKAWLLMARTVKLSFSPGWAS